MQLQHLKAHQQAMQHHVREVDMQYAIMFHHLQDTHAKWQAAEVEKSHLREIARQLQDSHAKWQAAEIEMSNLQQEIASQKSLQVRKILHHDQLPIYIELIS